MIPLKPVSNLATHEVTNMPPHLGDQHLWQNDIPLKEALVREGADWAVPALDTFGIISGNAESFEKGDLANRHIPELKSFDRYGMRLNQVTFHPAYHELMTIAIEHEVHSFAWNHPQPGAHVAQGALMYMCNQPDGGIMCAVPMTYAAIPTLKMTPKIGDEWIPKLLSNTYDYRDIPSNDKLGATVGMFMTEKQGGSDVRSNSTRAVPIGLTSGEGAEYYLTGHKYFCSAPMCDAFLTLAYTKNGLSCFLVPRWTPDNERNNLSIQRIKDKLGNRSNASSEIELENTWGRLVGEEGRGVHTIIEMVKGTRYFCCASSSALMRQALVQAMHHTTHRSAFQKKLIDQPLMQNVIADLALEVEASIALTLRIGRAMDESKVSESSAVLARLGTAIGKYWICKRAPGHIFEALECHGGPGYIEESIMPRLYREAPLNSIWEGSGNVMCLDVIRTMHREKNAIHALVSELEKALGQNSELDRGIDRLKAELKDPSDIETRARKITEMMATTFQAALLVCSAPSPIADAFCASRLSNAHGSVYGNLHKSSDFKSIISRILPLDEI